MKTREQMKPAFKQIPFYFLVAAPLVVFDIFLILPKNHDAGYVADAVAIVAALWTQGPLQRRFWP